MSALKIINARLGSDHRVTELYVENGYFVDRFSATVSPWQTLDLQGRLILPGLIESHIHLDKACIMQRCHLQEGTLAEAVAQTRAAKAEFTEDDVYQRGAQVLDKAIVQGTTHMRTHVELDPQIGLTGFNAIRRLQADYAWAISLEICVFPQEGMLNNPGTEALLCQALESGATVLGGCPYMDSDPHGQIQRLFELAVRYDCDLDLHLDFDLNSEGMTVMEVARCTQLHGWGGRVTIGHATKLSTLPREPLTVLALHLAKAGVQVTCLPSTDLFLLGREAFHNKPRGLAPLAHLHACGVRCSVSTNNIGNPFTPYGDASLIRQANLFANVSQMGTVAELLQCLAWVSSESAALLRLKDYGVRPGCRADFIVFDAPSPAAVIAEISAPLMGFKGGRQTFSRPAATLMKAT
ncbi:amidohydrolase [Pseudomonas sp. MYb2]|jgi:cytosine deaminase|uniref:amidohydrolase family protein n=1 Tax=unclassified Pseudomonas TaxID=196821 RepID=UPI0006D6EC52|nr:MULTISPECIES: amidohydrolase family protein [unclassified Pseudomonas]KPG96235.1 amidohydrolase [Pseudomonas sp. RIT-PI-r]PRB51001.1 amidohydrolase [Pseudomonas sp. MYb3]PRC34380.1 amidohydrolase [Pseudomonas sp. MYb2]